MNNFWKTNTMSNTTSNNFGASNTSNFGLSSNSNFGNAGNFSNSFGNANNPSTFGNQGMTSNFGTPGNFSNTFGATTTNPNSFGNQGMNSNFGSNFGNPSGMNNTGGFRSQPMSSNFGTSGNFASSMNTSTPFGTQQMNSNLGNNFSSFGNQTTFGSNTFQTNPNQPTNSMWQTNTNQPTNSLWQTNTSQPTNSLWQTGNPNQAGNSMWQTNPSQPTNSIWQTNTSQPTNSMWQANPSQPTNSMWGTNANNTNNFWQQNTNPMNNSFMQNQNNQQSFLNNQFGNAANGSSIDYRQTSSDELANIGGKKQQLSVNYVTLSAMPEYSNKSIEEIRYEDYAANRKMGASVNMQGSFNTNSFGNTGLGTSNFMSNNAGMNQSLPGNSTGNQLFSNSNTGGGFMNTPISQTNSNFWSTAGTNNTGGFGVTSGFQTANSGLGNRIGFPVNNTANNSSFSAVNSGIGNTPGLLGTNSGFGISAPNSGINTSNFPSNNTGFGISSNTGFGTNTTGFPQSNISLGNTLGFPSTNAGVNTAGFSTGNAGVSTGGFPSANAGLNTGGFLTGNTGVSTGGFPSANTGLNTGGFPSVNTGVNTGGFPTANTGFNTAGFPSVNTGLNTGFPSSNTGFNTGGFPAANTGLNPPVFPTANTGLNTAGFPTANPTGGNAFGLPAPNTGINTAAFPGTNIANKSGFPSIVTNTSAFPASNNFQNNSFGSGFQNNNSINPGQVGLATQSQISIPHVESSFYPPDMREKMEQIDRAVSLNSYSDISRDLLTYIACSPYSAINKHCDTYTDGKNTKDTETKKSSKMDESFLKSYKNDSFIDRYNINSSWEKLNRSALNYLTVHSHDSQSNASFTHGNKKLDKSTSKSLNNSSNLLPLYSVTQPARRQTPLKAVSLLRSPPKRRSYKELSVRINSLKASLLNRIPMQEVDTNVPEKAKDSKSPTSNCESFSNGEDLTSSVAFQPIDDTLNIESSINEVKTNLSKVEHEFVSAKSEDLTVRCSDSSYFLIPSLEDINLLVKENKPIHDLTVAKPGFGSIRFLKPVTLTCMDISETVCISKNIIELYPDNNWPPQGEGLNVHARVNVLNCWPYGKNSGSFIKDPDLIESYGWVDNLKEQTKEMDATFISYTPENGEWIFEINKY